MIIVGGIVATTREPPETAGMADLRFDVDTFIPGLKRVADAAHMSYFAASFLSLRTNWRADKYGGSLENRARMLVNVVKGVRQRLGAGFHRRPAHHLE